MNFNAVPSHRTSSLKLPHIKTHLRQLQTKFQVLQQNLFKKCFQMNYLLQELSLAQKTTSRSSDINKINNIFDTFFTQFDFEFLEGNLLKIWGCKTEHFSFVMMLEICSKRLLALVFLVKSDILLSHLIYDRDSGRSEIKIVRISIWLALYIVKSEQDVNQKLRNYS